MSLSNNFSATMTLNTTGGSNSPAPTDSFNSTVAVGNFAAGPVGINVTSTPTALPLSGSAPAGPATGVYNLMIAHTGASTDPGIVLDMQNTAAASSKVTINPGGRVYMYNVLIPITGTGATNWTAWRISVASGTTTASVLLSYT